jgi:cell division protein FtsB
MVEYSSILAAALAAQGYKDQVDSLHAKLSAAEAEIERLRKQRNELLRVIGNLTRMTEGGAA